MSKRNDSFSTQLSEPPEHKELENYFDKPIFTGYGEEGFDIKPFYTFSDRAYKQINGEAINAYGRPTVYGGYMGSAGYFHTPGICPKFDGNKDVIMAKHNLYPVGKDVRLV